LALALVILLKKLNVAVAAIELLVTVKKINIQSSLLLQEKPQKIKALQVVKRRE